MPVTVVCFADRMVGAGDQRAIDSVFLCLDESEHPQ